MCLSTFDGEQTTASDIIEALQTVPFMGGTRLVLVRRFDRLAADEQALLASFCEKRVPGYVLVCSAEAVDRRRKGIQVLTALGVEVDCSLPKGAGLLTWLRSQAEARGLRLGRSEAEALVAQVGERPDALLQELDKLQLYLGAEAVVTVDAIADVVSSLSPEAADNEIFQLCDAVAEGRMPAVLTGLDTLFANGANGIYIITMLARHYRRLLAVHTHGSRNPVQLSKELGLKAPPFAVEKLLRQAAAIGKEKLEESLAVLLQADRRLKRSAPPRATVEVTAVRLTQMAAR